MRVHRSLWLALLATAAALVGGCASAESEAQTRGVLQAFADTSSTRFDIVADHLAHQTDDVDEQAALNREKLSVANMGIENAINSDATTGLLNMAFQFDLKARSARQRVDRSRAAATQPGATTRSLDEFADELLDVHEQNRDDIWREVARRLKPNQLRGLRSLIDAWYAKNADLNRSSVQIAELQQFAGNDASATSVFSLINLKETNEQVDRLVWGAQHIYDNAHFEVRRILYDTFDQFEEPRDQAIAAVKQAVGDERQRAISDARGIVREAGLWLTVASGVLGTLAILAVLLHHARRDRRERRSANR